LRHRNHPAQHQGPRHRPGDPGGRGGPQGARRRHRHAGADAAAGRDHHRRAADGRPAGAVAAGGGRHAGSGRRGSRLPRFRQRPARHRAPDPLGRGHRSGSASMIVLDEQHHPRRRSRWLAAPLLTLSLAAGAGLAPFPAGEAAAQGVSTIGGQRAVQTVNLGLNKSLVIDLPRDAYDILVANPAVADAVTRTARRIYLFGKSVGETNIFVFGPNGEQIASIDLRVERDVSGLEGHLKRFLPDSDIKAELINDNVVLTGTVETPLDAKRAEELARIFVTGGEATTGQYSQTAAGGDAAGGVAINNPDQRRQTSQIVNMLRIIGEDQVTLKVTVAEVSRNVMKQLGVNMIGNGSFDGISWGAISENAFGLGKPLSASSLSIGGSMIDAYINAMEQSGVMKTLAEPTLTAVSGEKATFRVGGEFNVV